VEFVIIANVALILIIAGWGAWPVALAVALIWIGVAMVCS
jgi:hypothetical protein